MSNFTRNHHDYKVLVLDEELTLSSLVCQNRRYATRKFWMSIFFCCLFILKHWNLGLAQVIAPMYGHFFFQNFTHIEQSTIFGRRLNLPPSIQESSCNNGEYIHLPQTLLIDQYRGEPLVDL